MATRRLLGSNLGRGAASSRPSLLPFAVVTAMIPESPKARRHRRARTHGYPMRSSAGPSEMRELWQKIPLWSQDLAIMRENLDRLDSAIARLEQHIQRRRERTKNRALGDFGGNLRPTRL